MTTQAPARTAAEIAFDCRVNRIVDAWVSAQMDDRHHEWKHPSEWPEYAWRANLADVSRRDDPPPDAAMRAAVIAEVDAIAASLERRRRSA
jgi:hypothetical protein